MGPPHLEETGAIPPEPWRELASLHGPSAPAVGLSWYDASAYCSWAGVRLPTAEEWARAAGPSQYPWGEEFDPSRLHCGAAGPAPVGSYPEGASPYGCLDMSGNAREWTSSGEDPFRALCGGSYDLSSERFFEVGDRWPGLKSLRLKTVGFRVASDG